MRDDRRRIFLKLSGGSQLSSAPTKVSKKRQAACDQARERRVFRAQQFSFGRSRFADPVSNQRRD